MLTVQDIQDTVTAYFKDKPVKSAYLFGSYATGQEKPESDVDLILNIDDSKEVLSYFTLARFLIDLEELLKTKVDIVEEKLIYPKIKDNILNSRVTLFAK